MDLRNDESLKYWFDEYQVTDLMLSRLYRYYELISEYNKVMNLTGVDDLHGVFLKHYYDSLTISNDIDLVDGMTVADVGSGAGFPGIVLAICYPRVSFTLIEPLQKRCKFLNTVIDDLELKNVVVLNARSEDVVDKFDVVTSRAVARLNILSELCIPLVNVGGYFIALKGKAGLTEVDEASTAFHRLGAKLVSAEMFKLPLEESDRVNVVAVKTRKTDAKYPRNFSQIKSKPL